MAASIYDAVRAMCLEVPTDGTHNQLNLYPTELNPLQDALTAVGMYVQDSTLSVSDKQVLIDRIAGKLRLTDTITTHTLGELVSSSPNQVGSHNALHDAIHFMADGGPADGWASGMYNQVINAGPLTTSSVWYTSSAMTTKIVGVVYGYTGPLLTTITRTIYGANNAAIRVLTDTIAYQGPIKTGVTRTYA